MNARLISPSSSFIHLIILIPVLSLLTACNPLETANRRAEQDRVTVIYPETIFNRQEAEAALGKGTASIEGVMYTRPKNGFGFKPLAGEKIYAQSSPVLLFPVTPYLEEWYRLRKEKENKRTQIGMSQSALTVRLVVRTDDYGRFKFSNLKPGRYYLLGQLDWNEGKTRDVYAGNATNNYGTTDFYKREAYVVTNTEHFDKFVDIKEAGSTLQVNLK
jgi:hypothetical protein